MGIQLLCQQIFAVLRVAKCLMLKPYRLFSNIFCVIIAFVAFCNNFWGYQNELKSIFTVRKQPCVTESGTLRAHG